jgi:hypothetical protein
LSLVQGPFSVAPCQTIAIVTIRNLFIAVHGLTRRASGMYYNPASSAWQVGEAALRRYVYRLNPTLSSCSTYLLC